MSFSQVDRGANIDFFYFKIFRDYFMILLSEDLGKFWLKDRLLNKKMEILRIHNEINNKIKLFNS